jgi:hypothetical protein
MLTSSLRALVPPPTRKPLAPNLNISPNSPKLHSYNTASQSIDAFLARVPLALAIFAAGNTPDKLTGPGMFSLSLSLSLSLLITTTTVRLLEECVGSWLDVHRTQTSHRRSSIACCRSANRLLLFCVCLMIAFVLLVGVELKDYRFKPDIVASGEGNYKQQTK